MKSYRTFATLPLASLAVILAPSAYAQTPGALYSWAGTGNIQQWFKNFGTNTVTLDNTIAGTLRVIETGTSGSSVAISDDFNRVRESSTASSGGLDLTGLSSVSEDLETYFLRLTGGAQ